MKMLWSRHMLCHGGLMAVDEVPGRCGGIVLVGFAAYGVRLVNPTLIATAMKMAARRTSMMNRMKSHE